MDRNAAMVLFCAATRPVAVDFDRAAPVNVTWARTRLSVAEALIRLPAVAAIF